MSGNPFGTEIDALTTVLFELNSKIAGASGSVKEALQVERSAKLKSLAKLDAMSDDWRLGRLSQAVDALKSLAASELARQAKIGNRLKMVLQDLGIENVSPEPNEKQSNSGGIDNAPGTSKSDAIGADSGDATPHRDIHVDARAFDALSRVAQSEVGHFAKHGLDQLQGGVSAVVDTILNRVAHKRFPNSIEDVVNQPFQFSAINTLGSWDLLPSAKMNVQNIVRDYLEDRVSGAKGMLGGATHFLNPHLSSSNALSQWGNHVVANAVAEFGDNSKKDVHFHGFAPGTPLPDAYRITFGKISPIFDGRGDALVVATTVQLTQSIVETLEAELAYFDNGKHKEGNDEVWQRVGTYWGALGLPYHGRSKVTLANGKVVNPAWSAAFISWVIKQHDITSDRFKGAQGHWRYVADVLQDVFADPLFEVMDPTKFSPQPGDLVHYGREWASQFDLVAAKEHVLIDGFYPSHSDFVVDVDRSAGEITTIGGNVNNSVSQKTFQTDSNDILKPRVKNASEYPWIAILRLRS
ncbi:DUF2272 domain-containing protein [Nisaea sp.]|uniref:DUF2272 domain-containing protein n=1 Tax=Nisaea sp. TaxID=2024842 RepID=UPI003296A51A